MGFWSLGRVSGLFGSPGFVRRFLFRASGSQGAKASGIRAEGVCGICYGGTLNKRYVTVDWQDSRPSS